MEREKKHFVKIGQMLLSAQQNSANEEEYKQNIQPIMQYMQENEVPPQALQSVIAMTDKFKSQMRQDKTSGQQDLLFKQGQDKVKTANSDRRMLDHLAKDDKGYDSFGGKNISNMASFAAKNAFGDYQQKLLGQKNAGEDRLLKNKHQQSQTDLNAAKSEYYLGRGAGGSGNSVMTSKEIKRLEENAKANLAMNVRSLGGVLDESGKQIQFNLGKLDKEGKPEEKQLKEILTVLGQSGYRFKADMQPQDKKWWFTGDDGILTIDIGAFEFVPHTNQYTAAGEQPTVTPPADTPPPETPPPETPDLTREEKNNLINGVLNAQKNEIADRTNKNVDELPKASTGRTAIGQKIIDKAKQVGGKIKDIASTDTGGNISIPRGQKSVPIPPVKSLKQAKNRIKLMGSASKLQIKNSIDKKIKAKTALTEQERWLYEALKQAEGS